MDMDSQHVERCTKDPGYLKYKIARFSEMWLVRRNAKTPKRYSKDFWQLKSKTLQELSPYYLQARASSSYFNVISSPFLIWE